MNETKTNIIIFSTLLLLYHKSVCYMLATLVISLWWDRALTLLLYRSHGPSGENFINWFVCESGSQSIIVSALASIDRYVETEYVFYRLYVCLERRTQLFLVMKRKTFQTPPLVNQLLWQSSPSVSSSSASSPSPLSSSTCAPANRSQSRQRCSRRPTCTWNYSLNAGP